MNWIALAVLLAAALTNVVLTLVRAPVAGRLFFFGALGTVEELPAGMNWN